MVAVFRNPGQPTRHRSQRQAAMFYARQRRRDLRTGGSLVVLFNLGLVVLTPHQVAATISCGLSGTAVATGTFLPLQVTATISVGLNETSAAQTVLTVAATIDLGLIETAADTAAFLPLTLPGSPIAIYSTRQATGYVGPAADIQDGLLANHTIGFVAGVWDTATMDALPQPIRIIRIYDQSGNSNHATQATAANGPTYVAGNKGFTFDGDAILHARSISVSLPNMSLARNDMTVLLALAHANGIDHQAIIDFGGSPGHGLFCDATAGLQDIYNASSTIGSNNGVIPFTPTVVGMDSAAGACKLFCDGTTTADAALPSQTESTGIIGLLPKSSYGLWFGQFDLLACAIYASSIGATPDASAKTAFANCFGTDASYANLLVFDGDSIINGSQAAQLKNLPHYVVPDFTSCKAYNVAVTGSRVDTCSTRYPTFVKPLRNGSFGKEILHFLCGANDLRNNDSAATIQTRIQTYCATAVADGFTVLISTILPASAAWYSPTQETTRQTVNTWIRANYLSFAHVLVDYASNVNIGDGAGVTGNTAYYVDGLHPTALTYSLMKPDLETALNTALNLNSVSATMSIGLAETAVGNVNTLVVSGTAAIGLTETASGSVTWPISATMSIGLNETTGGAAAWPVVATMSIGLSETATGTVTWPISATISVGLNETATGSAVASYKFMIGGQTGTIGTSPDGITWTQKVAPAASDTYGLAFNAGSGRVVAVTFAGGVFSSDDNGGSWSSRATGLAVNYAIGLQYANSGFFFGGNSGAFFTSPDGITWTTHSTGSTDTHYCAAYGAGLYVVSGAANEIWTSPNTTSWTQRTSPLGSGSTIQIAYGAGIFVACNTNPGLMTSPDGITWTSRTVPAFFSGDQLWAVAFANGLFVLGSNHGKIATSPDGLTWTQRTPSNFSTNALIRSFVYSGGTWVAIAQNNIAGDGEICISTDNGVTWVSKTATFFTNSSTKWCLSACLCN